MKIKNNPRYYFQLLEVMIAAFILIICVAPAMQVFTNLFKEQQRIIQQNQREHLAKKIYGDLVEKLYKREFPLLLLYDKKVQSIQNEELKEQLEKIGYEGFYSFRDIKKKQKKGAGKAACFLLTLDIILKNHSSLEKSKREDVTSYFVYIDAEGCPYKSEKKIEDDLRDIENDEMEEFDSANQLISEKEDEKTL